MNQSSNQAGALATNKTKSNEDPTIKLVKDLSTTESNTAKIEQTVEEIDKGLSNVYQALEDSKTINSKLHSLDSALATTSEILEIVSIVPEISAEASEFKKAVDALKVPVDKATKISDSIETKVAPVRTVVQKAKNIGEKVDTDLLKLMNFENKSIATIGNAQGCLNALPSSGEKDALIKELNQFSSTIDPVVLNFDKVQIEIIKTVDSVEAQYQSVADAIKNLNVIEKYIDQIQNELSPIISSLKAITSVFNHTVRVPYGGYPKICHHHILGVSVPYPCGWHTVYFSFSVKDILEGADHVLAPVEDLLNDAVNKILSPLLHALHIPKSLPSIPYIDQLDGLYNKLFDFANPLEGTMQKFEAEFENAAATFNAIEKQIDQIATIYNKCELILKK